MFAEDAEEVVGGYDLAATLREIILKEGKESFVADARAEFFEEVCALKICRIGVGTETLPIVNWNIYKALRVVKVNSV